MNSAHSFSFSAMGTKCSLHLYAESGAEALSIAQLVIAEIERIEARFSRYRPDSDLSEINRVASVGGSIEVDAETAGLLDYAYAAYDMSDGLFDITSGLLRKAWDFKSGHLPEPSSIDLLLPRVGLKKVLWRSPKLTFTIAGMEIDFGGLAKEYAADRAAEQFEMVGTRHAVVDLGGDIRIVGPKLDSRVWNISIRHPQRPEGLLTKADISRGALATSGDYERCMIIGGQRYGHILHPKTGWPVKGLRSVSVIADQCLVAGTISTIAMFRGVEGISWLKGLGLSHVWMQESGESGGDWPNDILHD